MASTVVRSWEETAQRLLEILDSEPAARRLTPRRFRRMAEVASRRLSSVTVVLENLCDSHNVSAVVRTAEGLGLDEVHVVEEPNRYKRHPLILRGADRWLTVVLHPSLDACLARLRERGFILCAADLGPRCVPLDRVAVSAPLAVIMGSEKAGLSLRAKDVADVRFTVPMMGFTGSFNVSVSAAMALHTLSARRRRELGREGDLDEAAAVQRIRNWLGPPGRQNVHSPVELRRPGGPGNEKE